MDLILRDVSDASRLLRPTVGAKRETRGEHSQEQVTKMSPETRGGPGGIRRRVQPPAGSEEQSETQFDTKPYSNRTSGFVYRRHGDLPPPHLLFKTWNGPG